MLEGKLIIIPAHCKLVPVQYWEYEYLTIRLRGRVFYEQIVNEAQPSWLSLVVNEGE